jgi:putative transcriptional regulator
VESLQGHLLVASPALLDPNFRRTVVLVTEHTDEGAAGLVLNRPSPVEVAGAVPQLEPVVDDGDPVWVGGPMQPEAVLVLGEFLDPDDAAVPLFGALGFPSLAEPEEIVPATTRRRVFAGYAGWGIGQLEAELTDEDWILELALPDESTEPFEREDVGQPRQRKAVAVAGSELVHRAQRLLPLRRLGREVGACGREIAHERVRARLLDGLDDRPPRLAEPRLPRQLVVPVRLVARVSDEPA